MFLLASFIWLFMQFCAQNNLLAQSPINSSQETATLPKLPSLPEIPLPPTELASSDQSRRADARLLLLKSTKQLAYGPPLEATIRQRVWVADKTSVGVGLYQQMGQGQGKYRVEMVLPLGELKSELVQINDGHLAWSSKRTGNDLQIWRVDVMRLDDLTSQHERDALPPRLRVIGIIELLDALARDYDLELAKGVLNEQPVWIARGFLNPAAEHRLRTKRGGTLPKYVPNYVQIALNASDPTFPLMPLRIEYWQGNPQDVATNKTTKVTTFPQPIGLWEVTKYQAWASPDIRRFQFPADRLDVDPENRTELYAQRFTTNRTAVMLPERR